jgi:hypothetical protein
MYDVIEEMILLSHHQDSSLVSGLHLDPFECPTILVHISCFLIEYLFWDMLPWSSVPLAVAVATISVHHECCLQFF